MLNGCQCGLWDIRRWRGNVTKCKNILNLKVGIKFILIKCKHDVIGKYQYKYLYWKYGWFLYPCRGHIDFSEMFPFLV